MEKAGRKALPKSKKLGSPVAVKFTPAQRKLVEDRAKADGRTLAGYVRERALA